MKLEQQLFWLSDSSKARMRPFWAKPKIGKLCATRKTNGVAWLEKNLGKK